MLVMPRRAKMAVLLLLVSAPLFAQSSLRTIHVFVALADNVTQGIVPVSRTLGNGEDPVHNLYWGSAYGVKTFFSRSADWRLVSCTQETKHEVLERCIFKHRNEEVYLVADAYRGREIQTAILDFLDSAAGLSRESIQIKGDGAQPETIRVRGGSQLVAYVGHDGLMDSPLPRIPQQKDNTPRQVIILACASKSYFAGSIRSSGAYPLLWTTNLMAPEAYTLKSAIDGWILQEDNEKIRDRAASAYDKYQHCGFKAAHSLITTGW